jgi:xanthosine utilization system XapX-like protein
MKYDKQQLKLVKRISETEFVTSRPLMGLGIFLIILGVICLIFIIGIIGILLGCALLSKIESLIGKCPYCTNKITHDLTKEFMGSNSFKCMHCKSEIFINDFKFYTFEAIKDKDNPEIEVLGLILEEK